MRGDWARAREEAYVAEHEGGEEGEGEVCGGLIAPFFFSLLLSEGVVCILSVWFVFSCLGALCRPRGWVIWEEEWFGLSKTAFGIPGRCGLGSDWNLLLLECFLVVLDTGWSIRSIQSVDSPVWNWTAKGGVDAGMHVSGVGAI